MNGLPIARIAGFEIRLHLSWVLILAFLTLTVADTVSALDESVSDSVAWMSGAVVASGFLLSVLVHELAHAVVARRRGIAGGPITLLFFGGTASMGFEASRPNDEVAIAAAGSAASLLLGFALVAAARLLAGVPGEPLTAIRASVLVLGVLNILLGLVNVVPVIPLDGGRVLRAVVWGRTGDERAGTRLAAVAGRGMGLILTIAGLALTFAGDAVDGVMLIVTGWFMGSAARTMERRSAAEELLRGLTVDDAMERGLPTIAPQVTLDTFGDQLSSGAMPALPVVRDHALLGLVGVAQLRRVARRAWPVTRAGDLMVVPPQLPTLRPDDDLWAAVEALRRSGLDALPVVAGSAVLGVLTRRGISATMAARSRLQAGGAA